MVGLLKRIQKAANSSPKLDLAKGKKKKNQMSSIGHPVSRWVLGLHFPPRLTTARPQRPMYVHMELTSQPNDDTFLNIHQFHGSLLLAIMAPNPSPPQRKFEHPASSHAKKKFVQLTF